MPDETEKKYFADLLDDDLFDDEEDDEELTEEEKAQQAQAKADEEAKAKADEEAGLTEEEKLRRKNKDAEEARKRREAEAKAKAEEEAKAKEEAEKKAAEEKAEAEKKAAEEKAAEEAKAKAEAEKVKNQNALGSQLVDFKKKYPEIDLAALDSDGAFKSFMKGKLLGKQDFTAIYEDYLEARGTITGQSREETQARYKLKAEVSTSSSNGSGNPDVKDVYSEEEMKKLAAKLPFMSRKDAEAVNAKIERSIAYYKNKK